MNPDYENEFIESIDACFPYQNAKEWQKIIDTGCAISDNSAFMILHEICRAPNEIPSEQLMAMYNYWDSLYSHPLKEALSIAAAPMILSKEIPVEESAKIMNEVRKFPGLFTALSIPYCASNDEDGILDQLYEEITEEWRQGKSE